MQSDLRNLLGLQENDRAIMAIEEDLDALEPELAKLDELVAQLEETSARAQAELSAADERREELEGKIETYRVMQERRRQKLEWVRGAKEAATLMAEIDEARGILAQEETEWIRSAEDAQEIKARVAEAEELVAAEKMEQAQRRTEIAGLQDECGTRLQEAQAKRAETAKGVNANLLVKYGRILTGRAPHAMYELHDDACGHCFTAVPMHLRQQIRRGDTIATCEACGVIIFVSE